MAQSGNTATLEDVRYIAQLAHIDLNADEQQRMLHNLNAILGHIGQLSALRTEGVPPMAAGLPEAEAAAEDSRQVLRDDAPRPSLDRAEVLAQAPDADGVFFKVPRVIER